MHTHSLGFHQELFLCFRVGTGFRGDCLGSLLGSQASQVFQLESLLVTDELLAAHHLLQLLGEVGGRHGGRRGRDRMSLVDSDLLEVGLGHQESLSIPLLVQEHLELVLELLLD